MSITSDFPIAQRPWAGYSDPGLPVGMWIAQGTQLGDASGGGMSVTFDFKGEGEALGARFYNLEQMEMHTTLPTIVTGNLQIENLDVVGPTGLVNREINVALASDGITDSAMVAGLGPRFPVYLGRPQLVGLPASIRATVPNVLNETLFFTAQGYIWEPRSLLMDGGLRRPLDSLYGG